MFAGQRNVLKPLSVSKEVGRKVKCAQLRASGISIAFKMLRGGRGNGAMMKRAQKFWFHWRNCLHFGISRYVIRIFFSIIYANKLWVGKETIVRGSDQG
jgi:hypothetical protein